MSSVVLEPYTHNSNCLNAAARVYATTWRRDVHETQTYFRRYAQMPHFYGLVALVEKCVVGVTFGIQSVSGQWFHDQVALHVGVDHPALHQTWVLTELAVLPAYRHQAIGGALHDAIVEQQPFPRLLLSTQVGNLGARRFYARRGWNVLHPGILFHQHGPEYLILHRAKMWDDR
jgi:ribosomal protein S18 acetylase RimI-like enzyme